MRRKRWRSSHLPDHVTFYVNGPARLLKACIIADAFFPDTPTSLILLDQFGYDYNRLLPHVRQKFERIAFFQANERSYTHFGQFLGTYIRRYQELQSHFAPNGHVVLFGLRSPIQKFIIRCNRKLGNSIDIYAESIMVDRYFDGRFRRDNPVKRYLRRWLSEAFDYQHEYDRFFVHVPELYADAPQSTKIRKMPSLFRLASAQKYLDLLLRDVDLEGLEKFDTVLIGQPLSNFDGFVSPQAEEDILRRIVGDRRVLVLPHPNERLDQHNKYAVLPQARVMARGAPNDLICQHLRPTTTITYASTMGIEYALSNPESANLFYPVLPPSLDLLKRYREHVPNMVVSDDCVIPGAGAQLS